MSSKISKELVIHRLEQSKRELEDNRIREDSDYDDEYVANPEATEEQIKTATELIKLVEKYID